MFENVDWAEIGRATVDTLLMLGGSLVLTVSSQRCARSSGFSVMRGVTGKERTRRDTRPRPGSGSGPVDDSACAACVSTSETRSR